MSRFMTFKTKSKFYKGTHVIKYENLFLNTEKNGNMPPEISKYSKESRMLGLFTCDMQFINEFNLEVADFKNHNFSQKLISFENHNYMADYEIFYGDSVIIKRKRLINGAFFEKLELSNSGTRPVTVKIFVSSIIKDIFEVRGKIITNHKPANIKVSPEKSIIINSILESDNIYGVEITANENNAGFLPISINGDLNKIIYQIDLLPGFSRNIELKIQPLLNNKPYINGKNILESPNSYEEALNLIINTKKTEFAKIQLNGDIPNIQKTMDICIEDLRMLVNYININDKLYSYIGAGLPGYSALFGRDSIITALEILALNHNIARDTLELLAFFQGKSFESRYKTELNNIKSSNWSEFVRNITIKSLKESYIQREESPGKILHELRIGELVNIGIIPHNPYYGTVDATPLWLILYCEYYKWQQDKDFLKKLLPNAEAALGWIEANIINGYLRFKTNFNSRVKIRNQGWKDAGDSIKHIINIKGKLCNPEYPIALSEVQGYIYKAFCLMSEIYKELGENNKADFFIEKSIDLKYRFNKDFWLEEEQFFAMALDKNNKLIPSITSNIGHCLAMGIINQDKAEFVERKIISEELYTGWGIRTLSNKCPAYDPVSYHNGSVWVHDTGFAALGMSKKSMAEIIKGLFEAANMFENNRLPELFGGFQRKPDDSFIQEYPEACAPQAWASGSLIWLLTKLIGLKTKNKKLVLDDPYIPDWLKNISIGEEIKLSNKIKNIRLV
ncbi:MAG: amylo-alpha-1,6-glucosidase [bacterium]